MSVYVNSFPVADQVTLGRPDFRPCHHDSYLAEFDDNVAVNCLYKVSETTNDVAIHAPSEEIVPRIRRGDLWDFRSIWLRGDPAKTPVLRGYWDVHKWGDTNNDAVMVVQYKTFRISLRRGFGATAILSTADIDNILTRCLGTTNGDEMPPRVGDMVSGGAWVQWLISPVGRQEINDSIRDFRSAASSAVASVPREKENAIIAELLKRQRFAQDHKHKYDQIFRRHGIDPQRIEEVRHDAVFPPDTLDDYLDESLEALFCILGANDDEPGPLTLRPDQRAEVFVSLSPEMIHWARHRETQIATNAPEQWLKDKPGVKESFDRYLDLRELYYGEDFSNLKDVSNQEDVYDQEDVGQEDVGQEDVYDPERNN